MSNTTNAAEELRQEIIRLGPWHHDVAVTPEVSTRAYLDALPGTYEEGGPKDPNRVSLVDDHDPWLEMLDLLYPGDAGLGGRSFLECACNCGAYSFFSKEAGAGETFGFDVRDHWIDQAEFIRKNRTVGPTDGMRFQVADLYELPKLGLEPHDLTLFKGIFYHLPDPITGLKAAADLTREVLVLDTAYRTGQPDGMMAVAREGTRPVMTGVYGLNWFPTGPRVLAEILSWMGFPEVRLAMLREGMPHGSASDGREDVGRMRVVAARQEGSLPGFADLDTPPSFNLMRDHEIVKGRRLPRRRG